MPLEDNAWDSTVADEETVGKDEAAEEKSMRRTNELLAFLVAKGDLLNKHGT